MPTDKPIITLAIEDSLLEKVNDFRFSHRVETRSDAIRMLIWEGLKSIEEKEKQEAAKKEKDNPK